MPKLVIIERTFWSDAPPEQMRQLLYSGSQSLKGYMSGYAWRWWKNDAAEKSVTAWRKSSIHQEGAHRYIGVCTIQENNPVLQDIVAEGGITGAPEFEYRPRRKRSLLEVKENPIVLHEFPESVHPYTLVIYDGEQNREIVFQGKEVTADQLAAVLSSSQT